MTEEKDNKNLTVLAESHDYHIYIKDLDQLKNTKKIKLASSTHYHPFLAFLKKHALFILF